MFETEVAIYAKLKKIPLGAESIEEHIQYECMTNLGDKKYTMRVRHTVKDGISTYVLTQKTKFADTNRNIEKDTIIDEVAFNLFIPFSERKISKTRYTYIVTNPELIFINKATNQRESITINQLVIELDIYPNTEWVKIDIELDDVISQLPESTEYDLVLNKNLFIFNLTAAYLNTDKNNETVIREIYKEILGE